MLRTKNVTWTSAYADVVISSNYFDGFNTYFDKLDILKFSKWSSSRYMRVARHLYAKT